MLYHSKIAATVAVIAVLVPTSAIVASPALAGSTPAQSPVHRYFGCCGGVPVGCGYYGTLSQRRACVNQYYLENTRMSRWEHRCLITAISTSFGVLVGGFIGGFAGRAIAGAVVGGSASGCLSAVLNS